MRDVIEIAEVMEDTVLTVSHLEPPRPRRVSRWLFAAAAIGLAAFFTSGAHAVSVAAENRAALRSFIDGGGAPIDFHARRLSPFLDLAAISGLVSGLFFAGWALWTRRGERRASSFRTADGSLLVEHRDGEWRFTPAPGMTAEPAKIERGQRIRAVLGPVSYLVAAVAPPRAGEGIALRVDRRTLAYAGGSAAAHALLIALFFLLPATASGYSSDDLAGIRRNPVIIMKPSEDPKHERQPDGQGGLGGSEQPAAKERGVAGALGKPEAANETGRAKTKRVAEEPSIAPPTTEQRYSRARTAGVLGVLNAQRDAMTSMTASAEMTSGLDDEDIRGGWMGDQFRESQGWGSAPYGRGPGGGGHLTGTIGVGDYHTTPYSVLRLPAGTLGPRKPHPTFEIGHPEVPEGIDANTIRRYVRQKRSEITWCYQKELSVSPALAGTATTAFTIDENGRVIKVNAGGMGAPKVERCLEDVIRGIAFPKGQIVNVRAYPFTFHPAGG